MSKKLLTILFLSSFLACTSTLGPFESLLNKGVLPLSSDNAFLGTNLLLAKEMERSQYLYNFFEGRGAPRALEAFQSRSGVELALYYPEQSEMYIASLVEENKTHEWVIRGPFTPDRERSRMMPRLAELVPNEPIFEVHGRAKMFGRIKEPKGDPVTSRILVPVILPTPTPKPRPIIRKAKNPVAVSEATPTPQPSPQNLDQQALERLKGTQKTVAEGHK